MNQLTFRANRDMKHFDENDWTILGWQDRRELDDTETRGKGSNTNGAGKTDTVIGVVYVGVLALFMLAYLM